MITKNIAKDFIRLHADTPERLEWWKQYTKALAGWLQSAPPGETSRTAAAHLLIALCAVEEARFEDGNKRSGVVH